MFDYPQSKQKFPEADISVRLFVDTSKKQSPSLTSQAGR